MTSGIIFDIMKYSTQDGPGIRTTVFLKGCPLKCWWCHNPESQSPKAEIMFSENRCIGCGDCAKVCQVNLSKGLCTACGSCADICCTGARELVGKVMTTKELMIEIEKDIIFYEESGGGVTFSGGESLMQPTFLKSLLKSCKRKGIHTCIDTSGYGETSFLLDISSKVDLFLYDLKIMNNHKHLQYTGVSNELILKNLQELSKIHNNIQIRFPLITGINTDKENIKAMGEFLQSLPGITQLIILPFHTIGNDKYKRLCKEYKLPNTQPPLEELVRRVKEQLITYGLQIKIGG